MASTIDRVGVASGILNEDRPTLGQGPASPDAEEGSAMSVNEDRPSLGQRIVEVQRDLIIANREQERRYRFRSRSREEHARYEQADAEATALEDRREALLNALVAHTYTWAHDTTACPACAEGLVL